MSLRIASPGGRMDNRLTYQNSATGLNESIASEGGFLLENEFINDLFESMMAQSQVANRIRMIPIGANTNRLRALGIDENSRANGSRWGGVQAYWVAEAETAAQSKPKFREIEMSLQKLLATKSDYTDVVKNVKELLLKAGFKRLNEIDLYEEDTKIYHKGLKFYYLEEGE